MDGLGGATSRAVYFEGRSEAGLFSYIRCNNYEGNWGWKAGDRL